MRSRGWRQSGSWHVCVDRVIASLCLVLESYSLVLERRPLRPLQRPSQQIRDSAEAAARSCSPGKHLRAIPKASKRGGGRTSVQNGASSLRETAPARAPAVRHGVDGTRRRRAYCFAFPGDAELEPMAVVVRGNPYCAPLIKVSARLRQCGCLHIE